MDDANFVQSAQVEESSLDQAVNLGNCKSREFHVIRFGSSIITQILHNSHHFFCFLWTQLRIKTRELKFT